MDVNIVRPYCISFCEAFSFVLIPQRKSDQVEEGI